jgi:hypothetical protein
VARRHRTLLSIAIILGVSFGGAAFAAWLSDGGFLALPPVHLVLDHPQHALRRASASRLQDRQPDGAQIDGESEATGEARSPSDVTQQSARSTPVVTRRAQLRTGGLDGRRARPAPSSLSPTEHRPASPQGPSEIADEGHDSTGVMDESAIENRRTTRPDPSPAASSETGQHAIPATLEDGAQNVALAMERLRAQHDPAGALELLRVYRELHPTGMLSEEALALSIEAAAQIDPARAQSLAQEYLSRFPSGRFLALAQAASSAD